MSQLFIYLFLSSYVSIFDKIHTRVPKSGNKRKRCQLLDVLPNFFLLLLVNDIFPVLPQSQRSVLPIRSFDSGPGHVPMHLLPVIGTVSRRPQNRACRPETVRPESMPATRVRLNGTWLKFSTDIADPALDIAKFTRVSLAPHARTPNNSRED